MARLPRDEIVQLVCISSAWDGMAERCGTGQGSIDAMLALLLRKNHRENGCDTLLASSTSCKKLHVYTINRALCLVLCFHEPLYCRRSHTLKFPQEKGL
jgi:hypothetical protein